MSFHWVPVRNGQSAEEALNAALARLRVASVERHFCALPPEPGWAICIEHALGDTGAKPTARTEGGPKVDYKEILDPETFRIFAALREWRKEATTKAGVPVYSIMNNEQLAEAARRRCTTLADIESIEGVGPARVKAHGPALLAAIERAVKQGESKPGAKA
ncbi:MAG: HRDC domain-containing protein [Verrucomicrobiota bacterium]